jgi:hypothetical protein
MARHIHLYHQDFIEAQHPRGKGGKFAKVAAKGAQVAKTATKTVGREVGSFAKSFGKEDLELYEKHFSSGSETRRNIAHHMKKIATAFPKWLAGQGREEKEKFYHAGKALVKIATGNKPSRDEVHALIKAGTTIGMVSLTVTSHGLAPLLHHGLVLVGQEVAQEVATHTALEHAGTAAVGLSRFVHKRVRKQPGDAAFADDNFRMSPQEVKLMQDYIMKLAKNMEHMRLKNRQPKR